MMKKSIISILLTVFVVMLIGCGNSATSIANNTMDSLKKVEHDGELVKSEVKDVSATIISTNYMPYTDTMRGQYNITIAYDGVNYYLDNFNYYELCKDHKGEKVNCKLEIKYYDDGVSKKYVQSIIGLEK